MKKALTFLCSIALVVGFQLTTTAQQTTDVRLQLGFLIDGSGSIQSSDFTTVRNALSTVLGDETLVPRDGSVEVTVVQFSDNQAAIEVRPTVLTDSTITSIQQSIQSISQGGGGTPLWDGIDQITSLMTGSANFTTADRQTINIATDGQPQVPVQSIGSGEGERRSIDARDRAIAAGIDEIDAEGVGQAISDSNFRDFLINLVWPQPGVLLNNGDLSNRFQPGFVTLVTEFADFETAVRDKVEAILGSVGLNNGNGNGDNGGQPNPRNNNTAPGSDGRSIPFDSPLSVTMLAGVFGALLIAMRFRNRFGLHFLE